MVSRPASNLSSLTQFLGKLVVVLGPDGRLELLGKRRNPLQAHLHLPIRPATDHCVYIPEVRAVLAGIIVAELGATALLADQRRARDRLGDGQETVQVQRGVPPGIVLAVARRPR